MVDAPPPLVRPVRGGISTPFAYARATPFAAGQRRVLRITPTGSPAVRAPCGGSVTFAGRVPGAAETTGRAGVTLRCGGWAVTVSGLDAVRVAPGHPVRSGATVGRAGRSSIALGVRRASDPWGYVDPAPLLRDPAPAHRYAPLVPAPRPRVPASAPALRRTRNPHPVPVPASAALHRLPGGQPADGRAEVPLLAWVGLALAALGLPAGVQGRRRARAGGAGGPAAVGAEHHALRR